MNTDDDVPCLLPETAAALQEFLNERNESKDIPEEDWQLSQFWYDDGTCARLSEECISITPEGGTIVCISCPSLFIKLASTIAEQQEHRLNVVLLEFDRRFDKDYQVPAGSTCKFIWYDYKDPMNIAESLVEACDTIVLDPPFLAVECLMKTGMTVRRLSKKTTKTIVCTGDIMQEHVNKLLHCNQIEFKPHHKRNLANEFSCFTDYEPVSLNN